MTTLAEQMKVQATQAANQKAKDNASKALAGAKATAVSAYPALKESIVEAAMGGLFSIRMYGNVKYSCYNILDALENLLRADGFRTRLFQQDNDDWYTLEVKWS